ncbi:MAG: hypothetical protein GYA15_08750 [Leptolinea sp.]|jgi:hypothetical protein|nr:hypothetical protein [Leptolinea sp.]
MIKLELTIDEMIILVDLLDTAISEIRVEIMQTDNREYRKMLQDREILLKKLHTSVTERMPQRKLPEAV